MQQGKTYQDSLNVTSGEVVIFNRVIMRVKETLGVGHPVPTSVILESP